MDIIESCFGRHHRKQIYRLEKWYSFQVPMLSEKKVAVASEVVEDLH